MAKPVVFLLPRQTMLDILQRGLTYVDYVYHKKLVPGDNVLLKEYSDGKRADELMFMDGTIKSIECVKTPKTNPNCKRYGINIQLIMF